MSKTIPSQDLRWSKLLADPTCRRCGLTKAPADFPRRAVDYQCTACRGNYAIELYRKKRDAASPEELAAMRAARNVAQKRNREQRLARMTEDERATFMAKANAASARSRREARDRAYNAYGGYKCACCGETEPHFLSIDHINNDGAKHRRECKLNTGEQLYRWLGRNGFPSGFQVLCMNCQWGKRNNNGVCPHQVRCNDYPARE